MICANFAALPNGPCPQGLAGTTIRLTSAGCCLSTTRSILILFVFCQFALPRPARAADSESCPSYLPPEDAADASALSLRGVACFENKEFLRALIYYRQAYEISKSDVLRAGIGRSLQELGQPDLARQYYESYLKVASPSSDGYQKIEQRLEAIRETLRNNSSLVEIKSVPADAEAFVILDGQYWEPLGQTPVTVRMPRGAHRIVIKKTDFMTQETTIDVTDVGGVVEAEIELVSQAALFNVPSRVWKRRGVYLMAGSLPVILGGGALFLISEDRFNEADDLQPTPESPQRANELRDDGHSFRTAAIVTTTLGVAAGVTGLLFYLAGDTSSSELSLMPFAGPNSFGVAGSF